MAGRLDAFLTAARRTARAADALVEDLAAAGDLVVNVHAYGWPAYEALHRRVHPRSLPDLACLSMNPALHGAVQTGIPFTDARQARELLDDFDRLVARPPALATERVEMSGRKLRAWADARLGGVRAMHERILFVTVCPVAVLRGPNLLNVPLPSLRGPRRRAAERFYERHAPALVRAAAPRGLLLLGDYAASRWRRIAAGHADLAALPVAATHHPAARITNAEKFAGWSRALAGLEAVLSGTAPIRGS